MNTIEKHRAFLDSLDGEKGLPEDDFGFRVSLSFNIPLDEVESRIFGEDGDIFSEDACEYLIERCRRAESRQIPDLKEKVKELVRDAMDAQAAYDPDPVYDVKTGKQVIGESEAEQFRALCEPEKDSKEEAR